MLTRDQACAPPPPIPQPIPPPSRLQPLTSLISPPLQARVEELNKLQEEYDELYVKFREEKAALEAKYAGLYGPLLSQRADIIAGKDGAGGEPGGWAKCREGQGRVQGWCVGEVHAVQRWLAGSSSRRGMLIGGWGENSGGARWVCWVHGRSMGAA